ncbi:unnamed protein product [Durusdinium trenchii]|uniref:RING-type domain-containing protein n=1 Tax=Durusdinium trenchii TaxID=1381693 RepID=A0ABP0PD75_9DINO
MEGFVTPANNKGVTVRWKVCFPKKSDLIISVRSFEKFLAEALLDFVRENKSLEKESLKKRCKQKLQELRGAAPEDAASDPDSPVLVETPPAGASDRGSSGGTGKRVRCGGPGPPGPDGDLGREEAAKVMKKLSTLECFICFSPFSDGQEPMLSGECGHTIGCRTCAQALFRGRSAAECPICRRPFRQQQIVKNFSLLETVRDLQKHSGAVVQSKPPEEEPKPKLPAKLSDIVCDREEFLQRSQRLPIAGVASTPAPAPAPAPVPVRPVITRPVRPLGQMALGPPVSHEEVVHLEVPHDVRILQRMEDKRRELQRCFGVKIFDPDARDDVRIVGSSFSARVEAGRQLTECLKNALAQRTSSSRPLRSILRPSSSNFNPAPHTPPAAFRAPRTPPVAFPAPCTPAAAFPAGPPTSASNASAPLHTTMRLALLPSVPASATVWERFFLKCRDVERTLRVTIQKPDAENNLKVIGGNAHSRDEAVKRLMLGEDPPKKKVQEVQEALATHGLFTARGHGISMEVLQNAREESSHFFDLPLRAKKQCAEPCGYEIYPHHQRFLDLWTQHSCLQSSAHPELSAVEGEANAASGDRVTASRVTRCALGRGEAGEAEVRGVGIVCERFCCGPPVVCEPKQSPLSSDFYASELGRAAVEQGKKMEDAAGQVFFPANIWPRDACARGLRPALLKAFNALEGFSEAVLMLLAAAVGMRPQLFQHLMFDSGQPRHASMLQVCNYPSLLPRSMRPSQLSEYQLRAKAHQDFGAFTILARCPGTDSGGLKCGQSGALEVQLPGGAWMCVPARREELTVMPGTLMEYLTAGPWLLSHHAVHVVVLTGDLPPSRPRRTLPRGDAPSVQPTATSRFSIQALVLDLRRQAGLYCCCRPS